MSPRPPGHPSTGDWAAWRSVYNRGRRLCFYKPVYTYPREKCLVTEHFYSKYSHRRLALHRTDHSRDVSLPNHIAVKVPLPCIVDRFVTVVNMFAGESLEVGVEVVFPYYCTSYVQQAAHQSTPKTRLFAGINLLARITAAK